MEPELEELLAYLRLNKYSDLRVLEDGTIVGVGELAFTRAVYIGLNRWSFERRYCYENRALANVACAELLTGDDIPLEGYVAHRVMRG